MRVNQAAPDPITGDDANRFARLRSGPLTRRLRIRRGSVLLETVAALAVLGIVAPAALLLSSDAIATARRASALDGEVRDAQRLISAISLWPSTDLDRHLGESVQGDWSLRVHRPTPHLYEVRIVDAVSGGLVLETAIYRRYQSTDSTGATDPRIP